MKQILRLTYQVVLCGMIFVALSFSAHAGKLDTIKQRGMVHCGVNNTLPGLGFLNSEGKFEGFDVDFCKALAAAIFGDPNKVKYVPLTAAQRFTAIQSGEIDVLSRNTTWIASRDGAAGIDFTVVTFYDGQGLMAKKKVNISKISDLAGATICATAGTTTEKNITEYFQKRKLEFKLLTFENPDAVMTAVRADRCDAFTSDRSQLLSRKFAEPNPDDFLIFDETISKEPLGPAVGSNDSQWHDVISWTIYGMIEAEELGINSSNVDNMLKSDNPAVQALLGVNSKLGEGFGLPNDYMVQVIKKVGNYEEVFNRHLGTQSKFKMSRGLNSLWNQGGLLYAIPFK